MNRTFTNGAAVFLAVGLSLLAALGGQLRMAAAQSSRDTVTDASGTVLVPREYHRVVSLSILSDPILLELLEPERLIAGCAWSNGAEAFKLGARPRLRGHEDLETILALKPDLVVVAGPGAAASLARLRGAGIAVYDLGDLTGWEHCAHTVNQLGRLLCVEPRATRLLTRCEARLAAVATRPLSPPPRAVWVAAIGDRLYGGTVGSSYHDLLVRAGCTDAAEGRYRAWPEYSLEDLLALDAEVIVMSSGQAAALRRRPGAERLRARIIELPESVAGDPGLGLVDAVELLRSAL